MGQNQSKKSAKLWIVCASMSLLTVGCGQNFDAANLEVSAIELESTVNKESNELLSTIYLAEKVSVAANGASLSDEEIIAGFKKSLEKIKESISAIDRSQLSEEALERLEQNVSNIEKTLELLEDEGADGKAFRQRMIDGHRMAEEKKKNGISEEEKAAMLEKRCKAQKGYIDNDAFPNEEIKQNIINDYNKYCAN